MAGNVVVLERRENEEERVDRSSGQRQALKAAIGQPFHLS